MYAPTRILVAIREEFQSNKPDGLGILSEFYKIKLSSASLRKFWTENFSSRIVLKLYKNNQL